MKKYLFVILIALVSCKSKSRVVTSKSPSKKYTTKKTIPTKKKEETKTVNLPSPSSSTTSVTDKIIRKALSFKGTKYKYGGTTKSGMDCSGLMYTSFKSASVIIPRTSLEQSKKGAKISASKIKKGDLLFFKTSARNRINHVGLVVSVNGRDVKFVHSSSSRGVMISSLKEGYWSSAFSEARRLSVAKNTAKSSVVVASKKSYTVKKGDTLYAIARKYAGVTAASIMTFNKLTTTNLTPGMVLKIPK